MIVIPLIELAFSLLQHTKVDIFSVMFTMTPQSIFLVGQTLSLYHRVRTFFPPGLPMEFIAEVTFALQVPGSQPTSLPFGYILHPQHKVDVMLNF